MIKREIYTAVDAQFEHYSDDFFKLAYDLADRALLIIKDGETDTAEAVRHALDDGFIYTADIWETMAHYQTPETADRFDAENLLFDDLRAIVDKVRA